MRARAVLCGVVLTACLVVPSAVLATGTIDGVVLNGVNGMPVPGMDFAILHPETVAVPLEARTKRSVLESLVVVAGRTWQVWDRIKI